MPVKKETTAKKPAKKKSTCTKSSAVKPRVKKSASKSEIEGFLEEIKKRAHENISGKDEKRNWRR